MFDPFAPTVDLRRDRIEWLDLGLVFDSYLENQTEFSYKSEDEWDVATLLRLVFYER